MTVLVTGGAGYIGAHVVDLLREVNTEVVVVDDLSTGRANRLDPSVRIAAIDLARTDAVPLLEALMHETNTTAILHLAARKHVADSVARPAWYMSQNVGGLANILQAAERANVRRLVFSSSAAVYGETSADTITERHATQPMNPYGQSKLVGEWLLHGAAAAFGLASTSLRYFNVVGASRPDRGDSAVSNLVPILFDRASREEAPLVFGDDYPTVDGTCVRDFIDVSDLASAHLSALHALDPGSPAHTVFNVGTGVGHSVAEITEIVSGVTGVRIEPVITGRRAGDPASVVADASSIREELGWIAQRKLHDSVRDAWAAWPRVRNAA